MDTQIILVKEEPRGPSQLVEVPVTAAGLQRVNFPDVQQLRSYADQVVITKAIRLIIPAVLVAGPITGNATSPLTEIVKASLVLYCEGWEKGQYIPLFTLNDVQDQTNGAPHVYAQTRFDNWKNVDWSKTYIQYSNGAQSAGAPYAFLFDVLYQKFEALPGGQLGREIVGPS